MIVIWNLNIRVQFQIGNNQRAFIVQNFFLTHIYDSFCWLKIMTHLINTVLNSSWVIMNLVTSLFFNVKSWEVNFIFSKKIFTKRKANIKRQISSILSKDLDLTFFLRSIQNSRSPGRWISKKVYDGQFDQNWQNIKNVFPNMGQII